MTTIHKIIDNSHLHPVVASVNLATLKYNCRVIKNRAPTSKLLAVVKSNAYGHGIVPVTQALDDQVDAFGVAWLNEAIRIKENGVTKPLLLLKGVITQEDLLCANEYGFAMVVHNFHQIELIEKTPLKNPVTVWLKIDSGMHRLGFSPEATLSAYQRLIANSQVTKPLYLMTHFSDADDPANPKTDAQIALFQRIVSQLNLTGPRCIANSGGIWEWENTHLDWIRSGIMLCGASPFAGKTGLDLGLKPAMALTTKVLTIQRLKQGDQVGYGSTWTCPEDMPVGVINAGYGEGYPRHAASGTPVLINGVRCPIVGRVSMNMMSVDLRPCPTAQIGDPAVLWGEGLLIEEVAACADTIAYELFCQITQRVYFEYCHTP